MKKLIGIVGISLFLLGMGAVGVSAHQPRETPEARDARIGQEAARQERARMCNILFDAGTDRGTMREAGCNPSW